MKTSHRLSLFDEMYLSFSEILAQVDKISVTWQANAKKEPF